MIPEQKVRKSSARADQFFQSYTNDFWPAAHSGVGDFVAAKTSKINNLRFKIANPISINLEVTPLP
jgi:hypothetical protein